MGTLEQAKAISEIIIDSFFIVDAERTIIEYNRAFYSMLPRSLARNLRGRKCYEVLQLEICAERCIAEQCWRTRKPLRLDEIQGQVARSQRRLSFILSALPLLAADGTVEGAMVIHRNVTDEAQVQAKYQELLESEKREQERLLEVIRGRTRDLIQTSQELQLVQRELLAFRRGRIV